MAYSSIAKPTDYFNTVLYTGTGSSNSVTGVGFQPDWVWLKKRNSTGNHFIYDAVRGVQETIYTDATSAEATQSQGLTAFGADGFTVGTNTNINGSSNTNVSWNWLAANGTASNSDGSITSTVSANTTAGFSIVSYTGNGTDDATVGHGLSQKPDMVIIKARENTSSWATWHKNLTGSDYLLFLDATDAQSQYTTILKNQSSTVLTLGTNSASNANGQGFIAYCFAEKTGYSKIDSYTGNGNANGAFVYTGFKPAWLMIKRTDASGHYWHVYDNKRSTSGSNIVDDVLYPNRSDAEYSGDKLDIISNGFKCRSSNTDINASGGTYIYMAFAENPFVGNDSGTAVPVTAR